jgi:hypothetical protein
MGAFTAFMKRMKGMTMMRPISIDLAIFIDNLVHYGLCTLGFMMAFTIVALVVFGVWL